METMFETDRDGAAPRRMPLDERLRLVDAAYASTESERTRNVCIVQLLLHTPLDATALAALDVSGVDTELHELLVAERGETIALSDLVGEALELHLVEREAAARHDEQALFLTHRGTRMSAGAIVALVIRLGAELGVVRPATGRSTVTPPPAAAA